MMGADLPVFNTFQQKIAFEDRAGAIPRTAPFSIDLDARHIDWDEAAQMIAEDAELAWLADEMPGAMHHYGGWYTMTDENWPLIGPMGPPDTFVACAMSGFGTMAACASGELCAD